MNSLAGWLKSSLAESLKLEVRTESDIQINFLPLSLKLSNVTFGDPSKVTPNPNICASIDALELFLGPEVQIKDLTIHVLPSTRNLPPANLIRTVPELTAAARALSESASRQSSSAVFGGRPHPDEGSSDNTVSDSDGEDSIAGDGSWPEMEQGAEENDENSDFLSNMITNFISSIMSHAALKAENVLIVFYDANFQIAFWAQAPEACSIGFFSSTSVSGSLVLRNVIWRDSHNVLMSSSRLVLKCVQQNRTRIFHINAPSLNIHDWSAIHGALQLMRHTSQLETTLTDSAESTTEFHEAGRSASWSEDDSELLQARSPIIQLRAKILKVNKLGVARKFIAKIDQLYTLSCERLTFDPTFTELENYKTAIVLINPSFSFADNVITILPTSVHLTILESNDRAAADAADLLQTKIFTPAGDIEDMTFAASVENNANSTREEKISWPRIVAEQIEVNITFRWGGGVEISGQILAALSFEHACLKISHFDMNLSSKSMDLRMSSAGRNLKISDLKYPPSPWDLSIEVEEICLSDSAGDTISLQTLKASMIRGLYISAMKVGVKTALIFECLELFDPPNPDAKTMIGNCQLAVIVSRIEFFLLDEALDFRVSDVYSFFQVLNQELVFDTWKILELTLSLKDKDIAQLNNLIVNCNRAASDLTSEPQATMDVLKFSIDQPSANVLYEMHFLLTTKSPEKWLDWVRLQNVADESPRSEKLVLINDMNQTINIALPTHEMNSEELRECQSPPQSTFDIGLCEVQIENHVVIELNDITTSSHKYEIRRIAVRDLNPQSKYEYILRSFDRLGEAQETALIVELNWTPIRAGEPSSDLIDLGNDHQCIQEERSPSSDFLHQYSLKLTPGSYLLSLDFTTLIRLLTIYWDRDIAFADSPPPMEYRAPLTELVRSVCHTSPSWQHLGNSPITPEPPQSTSVLFRKFYMSGFSLIVQVHSCPDIRRQSLWKSRKHTKSGFRRSAEVADLSVEYLIINRVMAVLESLNEILELQIDCIKFEGLMDRQELTKRILSSFATRNTLKMVGKQLIRLLPLGRILQARSRAKSTAHQEELARLQKLRDILEQLDQNTEAYDVQTDNPNRNFRDSQTREVSDEDLDIDDDCCDDSRFHVDEENSPQFREWLERYTHKTINHLSRNRKSILVASSSLLSVLAIGGLNCGSAVLSRCTSKIKPSLVRIKESESISDRDDDDDILDEEASTPRKSLANQSDAWSLVIRGNDDFCQPNSLVEGLDRAILHLKRGFKDIAKLADQALVRRSQPVSIESLATVIPALVVSPVAAVLSALECTIQGARNNLDPRLVEVRLASVRRPKDRTIGG